MSDLPPDERLVSPVGGPRRFLKSKKARNALIALVAVGAVGYAPGPGFVWADGFWDLRGGRWLWVGGAWRRPPHGHAVWVRPYWEQHARSWRFRKGYWR